MSIWSGCNHVDAPSSDVGGGVMDRLIFCMDVNQLEGLFTFIHI